MIARRGLLLGMLAAPAIVRSGLVMPVKPLPQALWTSQNMVAWPDPIPFHPVRFMLMTNPPDRHPLWADFLNFAASRERIWVERART